MSEPIRVLVIEDGTEYTECYTQFLPEGFAFERAGSGPAALAMLERARYDAIVLDMRFDRAPEGELLGDLDEIAERFNGDPVAARAFLEDQQGTYVLDALRRAGCALPVIMSHDFSTEPRRWARLSERYAPLSHIADEAGPAEVGDQIRRAVRA